MAKNINNRILAISQTFYAWLLLAYPPGHRHEYGPAMAQLFRDQCRDAWAEAQGWGILKLWLRVLPDLVNTSIREHLAALRERRSVTARLANLSGFGRSPAKVFTQVFVVVFLVVFGLNVAITFMLPESYASDSEILIKIVPASGIQTDAPDMTHDLIQKQLAIINSPAVLGPVIDKLGLNQQWGKKYLAGKTLSTAETVELLKSRISVSMSADSTVMRVTVYSDDQIEAMAINRALLNSYRQYQLADVKTESPLVNGAQTTDAKSKMSALATFVPVVQEPTPGYLARPNKPRNISLGGLYGILLASVVGGVAALITAKFRRRNQNPEAV